MLENIKKYIQRQRMRDREKMRVILGDLERLKREKEETLDKIDRQR